MIDMLDDIAALNIAAARLNLRKALLLGLTARQLCADLILRARRQQGPDDLGAPVSCPTGPCEPGGGAVVRSHPEQVQNVGFSDFRGYTHEPSTSETAKTYDNLNQAVTPSLPPGLLREIIGKQTSH